MSNNVMDRIKELTDLALGWDADDAFPPISDPQALSSPETGNSGNKVAQTRRKLPQKAFPLAPENWEQTGTLVGTEAASPVPESWTAAVARLRQINCPPHVSPDRWGQFLADAERLLADSGQTLAASGWLIEDLFGREPGDPQSVAWRVRGQTIWTVVSENSDAVVLRGAGGRQTFIYRRADK